MIDQSFQSFLAFSLSSLLYRCSFFLSSLSFSFYLYFFLSHFNFIFWNHFTVFNMTPFCNSDVSCSIAVSSSTLPTCDATYKQPHPENNVHGEKSVSNEDPPELLREKSTLHLNARMTRLARRSTILTYSNAKVSYWIMEPVARFACLFYNQSLDDIKSLLPSNHQCSDEIQTRTKVSSFL